MAEQYAVPSPADRQTITCLYCGKALEIGRKTLSVTCKFCHKSLKMEDVVVKQYDARRAIETCGIITVEKKGTVVSDRLLCGGLVVRGKVKGNVTSRGTSAGWTRSRFEGKRIRTHAGGWGRCHARWRLQHRRYGKSISKSCDPKKLKFSLSILHSAGIVVATTITWSFETNFVLPVEVL